MDGTVGESEIKAKVTTAEATTTSTTSTTSTQSPEASTPAHNPTPSELGDTVENMIKQRIAHTLMIFPRLSPSMLQIGIGTGFPPKLWQPVLERMIADGLVKRRQVRATNPVSFREQTYTVIEANAGHLAALAGRHQAA